MANEIRDAFNSVYADGPSTSPYEPPKAEIRGLGQKIQDQFDSLQGTVEVGWHSVEAVRVATTANGTMASAFDNGSTVDGVTLATGDRILIKDQSSGADNGIYIVAASGAPTRATDADSSAELSGATVFVTAGTSNIAKTFRCTNAEPITVGTTALTWVLIDQPPGGVEDIVDEVIAARGDDASLDVRIDRMDANAAELIAYQPAADAAAFDRIPASQWVASFGRIVGSRAVGSTVIGYRGTYLYSDEAFDGVWYYLNLEVDQSEVTLAVYEDSSTTALATSTRMCRGNGWHFFKLDTRLTSTEITTDYFRVGAWVSDASGRLTAGRTRNTSAASGTNDQGVMLSSAVGTWSNSSSNTLRPAIRLVDTLSLSYGASPRETAVDTTIVDVDRITAASITHVTAMTDFNAAAATSTINAYGVRITKPVSFSANGIYFPSLRRNPASIADANKWTKLIAVIRDGSETGNVIASGEIAVDPEADELLDVYVPFTDKGGNVVAVTEADFPSSTFDLQIEACGKDGNTGYFSAPSGAIDIGEGHWYFRSSGGDTWTSTTSVHYAMDLVSATYTRTRERIVRGARFESTKAPRLALPVTVYAEVGVEQPIYLDNLVQRSRDDFNWRASATSEGLLKADRWVVTPASTGDQTLTFEVSDKVSGKALVTQTVTQKRAAANALNGETIVINYAGDSLAGGAGAQSGNAPTKRLYDRATAAGCTLTLIGNSGSGSNKYESFSGQTLAYLYSNAASPYVNAGVFDYANYHANLGDVPDPDWFFLRFGTNDVTGSTLLFGGGGVAELNAIKYRAIAANVRSTFASCKIAVVMPPFPVADQDGFGLSNNLTTARWFGKRKIHDYICTLMARLSGLESSEGIYLVPEHLVLDTTNSFQRTQQLANAGVVLTGTNATYAGLLADLTPASGALYYATDVAEYFVKLGGTGVGGWRPATEKDGVVRRHVNNVHPDDPGYFQMMDQDWAFLLNVA